MPALLRNLIIQVRKRVIKLIPPEWERELPSTECGPSAWEREQQSWEREQQSWEHEPPTDRPPPPKYQENTKNKE